jgi:hypothetical protein
MNGRLIGLLTADNITELSMIAAMRGEMHAAKRFEREVIPWSLSFLTASLEHRCI